MKKLLNILKIINLFILNNFFKKIFSFFWKNKLILAISILLILILLGLLGAFIQNKNEIWSSFYYFIISTTISIILGIIAIYYSNKADEKAYNNIDLLSEYLIKNNNEIKESKEIDEKIKKVNIDIK